MAKYSSKAVTVGVAPAVVADKFSDLTRLQGALDHMPADQRAKVGDVKFDRDSLSIITPQVGEIKFRVKECSPQRVVMGAEKSPIPLDMTVDLKPVGSDSTEFVTSIEVDIPFMLKPMLGGPMQKAVDQFSDLLSKLTGA